MPAADGLLEPAGHDFGGAALLHGGAERNGAGDEDVDFGVDGAVGLGGRHAAGEDHSERAGEGCHLDAQQVEGGGEDGGEHDGAGERRLAALAGFAVEGDHHQEGAIVGDAVERFVARPAARARRRRAA